MPSPPPTPGSGLHQLLDKLDKRRVDLLAKRAAAARKIVYRRDRRR